MESMELIAGLKVTSFFAVFAFGATMVLNAASWLQRIFVALTVTPACAAMMLAAESNLALLFVLALASAPAVVAVVCFVIQKLTLLRIDAKHGKRSIYVRLDISNAYRLAWGLDWRYKKD